MNEERITWQGVRQLIGAMLSVAFQQRDSRAQGPATFSPATVVEYIGSSGDPYVNVVLDLDAAALASALTGGAGPSQPGADPLAVLAPNMTGVCLPVGTRVLCVLYRPHGIAIMGVIGGEMRRIGAGYTATGFTVSSGVVTAVAFDTRVGDTDGMAPALAGPWTTFTVPPGMSGTWSISFMVQSGSAVIGRAFAELDVTPAGGTMVPYREGMSGEESVSLTQVLGLRAGHTIQAMIYQGVVGSLTVNCRLEMYRLGS
jgi:hypothetical protein